MFVLTHIDQIVYNQRSNMCLVFFLLKATSKSYCRKAAEVMLNVATLLNSSK